MEVDVVAHDATLEMTEIGADGLTRLERARRDEILTDAQRGAMWWMEIATIVLNEDSSLLRALALEAIVANGNLFKALSALRALRGEDGLDVSDRMRDNFLRGVLRSSCGHIVPLGFAEHDDPTIASFSLIDAHNGDETEITFGIVDGHLVMFKVVNGIPVYLLNSQLYFEAELSNFLITNYVETLA
jgi:hypothetical protein